MSINIKEIITHIQALTDYYENQKLKINIDINNAIINHIEYDHFTAYLKYLDNTIHKLKKLMNALENNDKYIIKLI